MKLSEINIRDPFILADDITGKYYLYAKSPIDLGEGFCVYTSADLNDWSGPIDVFSATESFWATKDFWAPEVYRYNGKYFLFGTFCADGQTRKSQILVSDNPQGPFKVHSKSIAPEDWFALDATLYIKDGEPYAVFSHEWVQIGDSQMCSIKMSDDLSEPIGEPKVLFNASKSGWSRTPEWNDRNYPIYVVDAPFVYNIDGVEFMLWSSWADAKASAYSVGVVYPVDGKGILDGEYSHCLLKLPCEDSGHAMIFKDFEGQHRICYHENNSIHGREYAVCYRIGIKDGKVVVFE